MTDTEHATLTELEHLDQAAAVAGLQPVEVLLPQHLTVAANGLRFHLVDWGHPDKPTILFLHGVGLTARTWDLVCLVLRQDYHCLALDMRGHGDSEWAPEGDYSTETQASDVKSLTQLLGLDHFLLVGHSMGGMVALTYAETAAPTLRALVLVDSAPGERNPPPPAATPGANNVFNFMAGPAELDSVEDFVERAMAFNPARDRRLLRRSLLHNLRQLPDGRWTWKYDRAQILRRDRAAMAASRRALWDGLSAVTVPTLLTRGARSESLSNATAAEFTAALPDGRWEIIADAGHTIQGDNPRGLLQALEPFFNSTR
ncbi:MAG: alpha/beta hydrolase [Chloroflexi bacterium]|nr:alpha/beta hydrolase [Chloroflexota bacterium]